MKLLNLTCALLLVALPAFAQYNPSPNDPQAPVELPRYHGNMSDFKNVQLMCVSDTSGDYISNALCTVADTEVRTGAREAGLNFKAGSGREDGDTFNIYIHIMSAGTAPRGMAVQLEASRYYEEALDRAAMTTSAAGYRRAGKLVMWEENITGVGQGDSLEGPMRSRMRIVLRDLFKQIKNQER